MQPHITPDTTATNQLRSPRALSLAALDRRLENIATNIWRAVFAAREADAVARLAAYRRVKRRIDVSFTRERRGRGTE